MNEFTQLIISAFAAIVLFTALHFGALVTGEDAYSLRVVVLLIPCVVAAFFYNAIGCSSAFATIQGTLSVFYIVKSMVENASISFGFILVAIILTAIVGGLIIFLINAMAEGARKVGIKVAWLFAILGIEVCAAVAMLLAGNIYEIAGIATIACWAVVIGYFFGRNQRALVVPAT